MNDVDYRHLTLNIIKKKEMKSLQTAKINFLC